MSTINQIQLPNGSTYDFEDTVAREEASSKADKTVATASANGLMSAADKAKLDGITSTYATKSELSSHSQNTSNPHKVTASQVGALPLSGGSLTGNLTAPSFQTGTGKANYFQCRKFRGEGDADNYYHAVDFGYAGHNQVDFYEYGGKYVFHRHQQAAQSSGDAIIGEINGNGFVGKVNGHTINADVPAGAKFTDTTYGAATQSADGLMSAADKSKLDGIGAGSNVKSVNGKTGAVTLEKGDVGLGSVDNTKDVDKPISTAMQTALDKKADKTIATSSADGLMSKTDKAKLDGIEAGSNVKSVNGKTGAITLEKGDVGLGSVANLDQSKAIKSITRNGTTFTATALDGTTSTFTQQDTTYGVATSSADGLMSAADKSKLDGIGAGSNVKSVNGKTGAVSLSKADVGLGNVDNTSDADKPYYKLIGQTATNTNEVGHFNFNDASQSLYKIKNFYAASVEGDHFYLVHKKSDYTITATKHFSNTDNLFTADLVSDCTIATNLISESDPAILTIVRNHKITTSDALTLIFYEHSGWQSNARLNHWKLEIMAGGGTSPSYTKHYWKDGDWLTVSERTNVSDSINCLWCGLNPYHNDGLDYIWIKGIRITIYAATPYSTKSGDFGYNQLKIAGMRLLESRPLFSPAEALGALDVAGGTVYGKTTFQEGISATSYSGATATSSADGLMSKDDKAKLDDIEIAVSDITSDVDDLQNRVMTINRSLENKPSTSDLLVLQNTMANNYYTKNPQNLRYGFNSTDRASMNHLKNGWYWHSSNDGALNFPSEWGFMFKFGYENDGDFSALYFTQMTGAIYRCSGNANGISGWVTI